MKRCKCLQVRDQVIKKTDKKKSESANIVQLE